MRLSYLISSIFLVLASPLFAQDIARAERIQTAWQNWVDANNISESSIAIGYDGALFHSAGAGRMAEEPADIASLSKAITAVCALQLLDQNLILGDVLDPAMLANNSLNSGIKISSLINQSSGLNYDATQDYMIGWLAETGNKHMLAAEMAFSRGPVNVGEYFYNNENYAILGLVISQISNDDYFETCRELIFDGYNTSPIGLSERWGDFAAWGGWKVSAVDYLDFIHRYFGPNSEIGQEPRAFASIALNRGSFYGLGTLFRQNRSGGFNFWHFGRWCKEGAGNTGAYFASYGGRWSVSVNYNACLTSDQSSELDLVLWQAANE